MLKTVCLIVSLMLVTPLQAQSRRYTSVSMVRLIADPQSYDTKSVSIVGFVRIRFEGTAIYLHQEDDEFFITKNALWLDISKSELKQYEYANGKYMLVEGDFDAKNTGRGDNFSGTIKNIRRIQVWAK